MKTPLITGLQESAFENISKEDLKKQKAHHKKLQKEFNSYAFDMIDALEGPILTFSPQWKDCIPPRMLDIIPTARLTALFKNEELATIEECVVYIYTRMMDAPMDHEWTDIFTHISCKVMQRWFGEDHWEDTKAPKELNDWLNSQLTGLRRWIYDRRRKIFKRH